MTRIHRGIGKLPLCPIVFCIPTKNSEFRNVPVYRIPYHSARRVTSTSMAIMMEIQGWYRSKPDDDLARGCFRKLYGIHKCPSDPKCFGKILLQGWVVIQTDHHLKFMCLYRLILVRKTRMWDFEN